MVGASSWLQYSHAQQKITTLQQDLSSAEAALEDSRTELEDMQPKFAHLLIREQARSHHAGQMRRDWVNTFGYKSTIQVKTPEQIAFPDRDLNQMIDELIRLSHTSKQPMDELVQEVVDQ